MRGVTYTVQYRDENNTWVEVGSDPDLFPADSFTVTTKVSDIDATKIGTRTFWPAAFWNP